MAKPKHLKERGEIWAPIRGFEGRYEISSFGRVNSLIKKPVIINPTLTKAGYLRINLRKDNKTISKYVHVLSLESFCCPRPNKQHADHIDGNRINNNLLNLRWLPIILNCCSTPGYLNKNTKINFYKRNGFHKRGEICSSAILTEYKVLIIKKMINDGYRSTDIANFIEGASMSNISHIKRGFSWTHVII